MRKTAIAAGLLAAALAAGPVAAQDGDAEAGERVFRKCQACHQVGPDASNRVGPELNGIIGREIASVPDFTYSDAFMAKKEEGFVWTEETIGAYLMEPRDYIPGNKMSFAGLRKQEDVNDVLAYLATFQ